MCVPLCALTFVDAWKPIYRAGVGCSCISLVVSSWPPLCKVEYLREASEATASNVTMIAESDDLTLQVQVSMIERV